MALFFSLWPNDLLLVARAWILNEPIEIELQDVLTFKDYTDEEVEGQEYLVDDPYVFEDPPDQDGFVEISLKSPIAKED